MTVKAHRFVTSSMTTQICVKHQDKTITLAMQPNETILLLKKKIMELEGIPAMQQSMYIERKSIPQPHTPSGSAIQTVLEQALANTGFFNKHYFHNQQQISQCELDSDPTIYLEIMQFPLLPMEGHIP